MSLQKQEFEQAEEGEYTIKIGIKDSKASQYEKHEIKVNLVAIGPEIKEVANLDFLDEYLANMDQSDSKDEEISK